ncbi:MAG: BON domain-containing protein [Magnetococcales bacterium]|nr:BON domain-containing protein [Magnetococcales bacterium]
MALSAALFLGGCNPPSTWMTQPENTSEQAGNTIETSAGKEAPVATTPAKPDLDPHGVRNPNPEFIQDDRLPRIRQADMRMETIIKDFFRTRLNVPERAVDVDVWEGRALLTGNLDNTSPKLPKAINRFLRAYPHIRILYNHAQTTAPTDSLSPQKLPQRPPLPEDRISLPQEMTTTTKSDTAPLPPANLTGIEERMAFTRGIRPANYRWRTKGNTVYLIGRAVSQAERDTVVNLFQQAPGVSRIEDYIQIKGE